VQKIVIGTLLIAALSGLSACAVDTSTDEEALDEPAGEPGADAADADPSGDDVAGSEGETDEPVADETDWGEDEIVEKGRCGDSFHPKVNGGEAAWSLSCHGGVITISGWVRDTRADGRCARVRVHMPNGDVHYSQRACPRGRQHNFTFSGRGGIIDAYLETIPASS
jgi:hypothetical protein